MTSKAILTRECASDLQKVAEISSGPVKNIEGGSADRSDSGMEEESLLHTSGMSQPSDVDDSNDDDDFGGFMNCRSKGRRKLIIDDDEDEDEEEKDDSEMEVQQVAVEDDKETRPNDECAENADMENKDADSDETDKAHGRVVKEIDSDDEDVQLKFDFKSSDVFDAEDSDEDHQGDKARDTKETSDRSDDDEEDADDTNNGDDGDHDEGFEESEMSPSLLAKLKKMKGAAKSDKERAKYSRKAKPSAEKMLEIYSESQRLLRDSRVHLPYYEPQPKSLDDFLARAAKKKQLYAGLRNAKDFQKAQVIQDQLSITPPKPPKRTRTKSKSDKDQRFSVNSFQMLHSGETSQVMQRDDHECTDNLQETQKTNLDHSGTQNSDAVQTTRDCNSQHLPADDSGVASQDVLASQSSTVLLQSSLEPSCGLEAETAGVQDEDEDELPDIELKQSVKCDNFTALKEVELDQDADVNEWCKEQGAIVCNMNASGLCEQENIANDIGAQNEDQPMTKYQGQTDQLSVQKYPSKNLHELHRSSLSGINEGDRLSVLTEDSVNHLVSNNQENGEDQLDVPSLKKDPSRDLFRSQSSVGDSQRLFSVHSQSEGHTAEDSKVYAMEDRREETIIQETQCSQASALTTNNCPQASQADDRSQQLATMEIAGAEERISTPKTKLTDRLKDLQLPANPHLSGTPDEIICLDDPQTSPVSKKNPGLVKLMDRMAQHARKSTPRSARDVSFSIIQKEGEGDKKELTLKSVTYRVKEEAQPLSCSTPGSKLAVLKQQLRVGMRKKREESRQRRLQLYALENEEGFEREAEDAEEEEEAEETDNSDSEEEEEEEEEDYYLKLNDTMEDSDNERDYNPLMDMEAKDDEDENYENDSNFDEDSNEVHLRLDVSDEEGEEEEENSEEEMSKFINDDDDEEEEEEVTLTSLRKKKRAKVVVSDDEDVANEGNGDENEEAACDNDSDDDDDHINPNVAKAEHAEDAEPLDSLSMWSSELTPLTKHLQDTQPPQGQSRFRRENSRSPDLYSTGMADESESSQGRSFDQHNDSSQSYYNLPSQLLDADGYLKLTQTQQPPKSRIALLAQQPTNDKSSLSDLDSSMKLSAGNIFNAEASQARTGDNDEDDENMRELMGLCSGTFGPKWDSEDAFPLSQNGTQSTQSFEVKHPSANNSPAHEIEIFDPFHILSDDEDQDIIDKKSKWKKPALSDSEDERNDDDNDNDARERDTDVEDDEDSNKPVKFAGFKEKKRGIKREFLEEEAELSGSEAESDEDLDLAEEEDILEEEAGDRDMAGISDEKLRDEVGRMHMKQLQDDDDREVMRFKEMYLQDGDLYSEGGGRTRNFRWKNIDDNTQSDMFGHQSDDEQGEEDGEDPQWRKERYEREKFIESSDPTAASEDSQMLKLGQVFLRKKESIPPTKPAPEISNMKTIPPPPPPKPKMQKKGSFLSRSKETLVKIAQITRGTLGGQSGKNARSFVFQTVESSETQDENLDTPQQPPKRKAHSAGPNYQAAKKPKIAPSPSIATPVRPLIKRQSSIFNLLEDK